MTCGLGSWPAGSKGASIAEPRDLLEEYVAACKALQLATLRGDGAPVACNLWYAYGVYAPPRPPPARPRCAPDHGRP
jgi:hypothetical protein